MSTADKLEDAHVQLQQSLRKMFPCKLPQQVPMSYSSTRRAVGELSLCLCRVKAVLELTGQDTKKQLQLLLYILFLHAAILRLLNSHVLFQLSFSRILGNMAARSNKLYVLVVTL
jgi:hypothetical protein